MNGSFGYVKLEIPAGQAGLTYEQVRDQCNLRISDDELKAMFKQVDLSKDNLLQINEIRLLNQKINKRIQELKELESNEVEFDFSKLDANNDGQLEFSEISAVLNYVSVDKRTLQQLFSLGKQKNEPYLRKSEFEFFKQTVEGFPTVEPEERGATLEDVFAMFPKVNRDKLLKLYNYYDRSGDGTLQDDELSRLKKALA